MTKTNFRAALQSYLVLQLFYSTDKFLAYIRKTN